MPLDFLQLADKSVLVMGVANRKSLAYHCGQLLTAAGAQVVYSVRSAQRRDQVVKLLPPGTSIYVCDVEREQDIQSLAAEIKSLGKPLDGVLHSIAFAPYSGGVRPFFETPKADFLRAIDISCYSLAAVAGALRETLSPEASIVATSISTTRMASENYGYMAPVKAALDSSLAFLAKAFSQFSRVRFNAVAPGLLKSSASAGIPGYVESYLYAEKLTLRRRAVQTEEAAAVAAFLLSPRSSGINAQTIVVDAGMSVNYFDREIIERAMRPD